MHLVPNQNESRQEGQPKVEDQNPDNWDKDYGPIVNGKIYPLWGQFVMNKAEWIGGELSDYDEHRPTSEPKTTKIKDIQLIVNGDTSAALSFIGEDFEWTCDVHHLGISGGGQKKKETLTLLGIIGMKAVITKAISPAGAA